MKKMTQTDILQYIRDQTDFFAENAILSCREISDGNINYVYRIEDSFHRSLVVKYAHSEIRTSGNRCLRTAAALKAARFCLSGKRLAPVYRKSTTMTGKNVS